MIWQVKSPVALMSIGLIVGATSVGWWFMIGSVSAVYSSLLFGNLAVLIGLALSPSRRRITVALLLAILMWRPALFGDLIWA